MESGNISPLSNSNIFFYKTKLNNTNYKQTNKPTKIFDFLMELHDLVDRN